MTYIVAEIETPTLGEGKELIDKAIEAGADAVKVQYYKADDLVAREDRNWTFYQEREVPWKRLVKLYYYAKDKGIDFGVSVFAPQQVIDVEPYCDYLKVASPEAMDWALIDACIATGKRVMVSVSSSLSDAHREALIERFKGKVDFLWCPSGYPADQANNWNEILGNPQTQKVSMGLSDHSCGTHSIDTNSIHLLPIIEKHMGYKDNSEPWVLHPEQFKKWVSFVRAGSVTATPLTYWKAFDGKGNYVRQKREQPEVRQGWNEPAQLSLFDAVPEGPKLESLETAIIDTQLQGLLRQYSWEDIERAILRLKERT